MIDSAAARVVKENEDDNAWRLPDSPGGTRILQDEDMEAIIALVERAIVAEAGTASVSPLPAAVPDRRKPKKFALAEVTTWRSTEP